MCAYPPIAPVYIKIMMYLSFQNLHKYLRLTPDLRETMPESAKAENQYADLERQVLLFCLGILQMISGILQMISSHKLSAHEIHLKQNERHYLDWSI